MHAATPEILAKGTLALFALAPELRARPARRAMMTAPRGSEMRDGFNLEVHAINDSGSGIICGWDRI